MRIAVFCASAEGLDPVFTEMARRLGTEIGRHSWKLIYGGTNLGLMKEVAESTAAAGGEVIGVIPVCIRDKGVAAADCGQLLVTADMKERKQLIRDYADAFVALPGGWGTLEEITEVITLKQLGMHNKPIVFLNTACFYNRFFDFICAIRKEGFISENYRSIYRIADTVEETIAYIQDYQPAHCHHKYQAKNL